MVSTAFERGNVYEGVMNIGLQGEVLGPQVNRWTSMKGLHIFDNSFSGKIADEIGDLKYLVFLRAQNNEFTGTIPNEIVKLEKLREVFLSENYIWGELPPDIGFMQDLGELLSWMTVVKLFVIHDIIY